MLFPFFGQLVASIPRKTNPFSTQIKPIPLSGFTIHEIFFWLRYLYFCKKIDYWPFAQFSAPFLALLYYQIVDRPLTFFGVQKLGSTEYIIFNEKIIVFRRYQWLFVEWNLEPIYFFCCYLKVFTTLKIIFSRNVKEIFNKFFIFSSFCQFITKSHYSSHITFWLQTGALLKISCF